MFLPPKVEQKIWGRRTPIYTGGTVEAYMLELEPVDGKPVACSVHHHIMKWNRFFVVSGSLGVEHGVEETLDVPGAIYQLQPGESYTVPPGDLHRFIVLEPSVVIEVTWADTITEDIVRQDVGHVLGNWP